MSIQNPNTEDLVRFERLTEQGLQGWALRFFEWWEQTPDGLLQPRMVRALDAYRLRVT